MWRNPKFFPAAADGPDAPRPGAPPEPRGRPLASFPRRSRQGPEAELRVSLDEFNGHPFISVRVWERGRDRQWWPVRGKGVSIRIAEAEGVAAALAEALELASAAAGSAGPRG